MFKKSKTSFSKKVRRMSEILHTILGSMQFTYSEIKPRCEIITTLLYNTNRIGRLSRNFSSNTSLQSQTSDFKVNNADGKLSLHSYNHSSPIQLSHQEEVIWQNKTSQTCCP